MGTLHDACVWPVQPPAGTSVYGSNVGLPFKSGPVYGTPDAQRVPPIWDVPYASQSKSSFVGFSPRLVKLEKTYS